MEGLELMANEVITSARERMKKYDGLPSLRTRVLQEMHAELVALKATFEAMHPTQTGEVNDLFKKLGS